MKSLLPVPLKLSGPALPGIVAMPLSCRAHAARRSRRHGGDNYFENLNRQTESWLMKQLNEVVFIRIILINLVKFYEYAH
jgi:hypothetical protein